MASERLSSCQGKAIAVLAAVFIAGAASGAIGMRALGNRPANIAVKSPYDLDTTLAVERLAAELTLAPDQVAQVQTILDETIMQEADLLLRIKQMHEEGRHEIEKILTPEQREKFEDMAQRAAIN